MGMNAVVGQSGGPTAVINASLAGVFSVCRHKKCPVVYGMRYGVQGLLSEKLINLNERLADPVDEELLKHTPSSFLGSCRYKLPDAKVDPSVYEKLFEILKKYDIGYFFYIGGNDSMDTILKLSDYGASIGSPIRFIGVPKTIDNDLMITDHTPGYGSAAKYIATASKELVRDSTIYDLRSVTVMEVMGRNAGWLTAAVSLAQGEDCEGVPMICLPETVFDVDRFLERVHALQNETPSLVIAVSEGIRLADGRYVCELGTDPEKTDAFGHRYLGGTARYLSDLISEKLRSKSRAVEFSTLQRCAAHSSSLTDIQEAYRCGGAAAEAAFEGKTGVMIALKRISDDPYHCSTEVHDIHDVANFEKTIPAEWITEDGFGLRDPFIRYARPLIQSEITPMYVHGLPRHIRL